MASIMERYSMFVVLVIMLAADSTHVATSVRLSAEEMMVKKHEHWMAHHGRVYKSKEEKEDRFKIFKDNVKFINDFNQAGNKTYKIGINQFTDLTSEEFLATYASGYKKPSSLPQESSTESFMHENVDVAGLPPFLDWRAKGAVTPVKNQGGCSSCWAFSAVAAIEGINKIKTGRLISLSEQQIVDCMGDTCDTLGSHSYAFDFVASSGGITTESDYPFIQVYHEACRNAPVAARITTYERVPSYNEVALLKAVANQPVSVGIDSTVLQYYYSGVITSSEPASLNHDVAIVGYGVDKVQGIKYWLAKNSWGSNWGGEGGYFRVQRDSGLYSGTLGILEDCGYPVI